MGAFIKEMSKETDLSLTKLFFYIGFIMVTYWVAEMFGEHSNFITASCNVTSGQLLRCLMYTKLKRCNKSFLEIADASLISKLLFFEIEIILNFISQMSEKIASPVTMLFTAFVVYT